MCNDIKLPTGRVEETHGQRSLAKEKKSHRIGRHHNRRRNRTIYLLRQLMKEVWAVFCRAGADLKVRSIDECDTVSFNIGLDAIQFRFFWALSLSLSRRRSAYNNNEFLAPISSSSKQRSKNGAWFRESKEIKNITERQNK